MRSHSQARRQDCGPRLPLKVAFITQGLTHQEAATRLNSRLRPAHNLTENAVTKIVTGRRMPTRPQARAMARLLRSTVTALFPELGAGGESR